MPPNWGSPSGRCADGCGAYGEASEAGLVDERHLVGRGSTVDPRWEDALRQVLAEHVDASTRPPALCRGWRRQGGQAPRANGRPARAAERCNTTWVHPHGKLSPELLRSLSVPQRSRLTAELDWV